jgi:hypothetical protein
LAAIDIVYRLHHVNAVRLNNNIPAIVRNNLLNQAAGPLKKNRQKAILPVADINSFTWSGIVDVTQTR